MQTKIPTEFVLLSLCLALVHGASWSYSGNTGPSNWASISQTCAGSQQSPINIDTSSLAEKQLGDITLTNYENPVGNGIKMKNNGHSVTVDLTGSSYSISGGGLSGTFNLDQFHFHWGTSDSTGSEHTLDGKQYPMEVHFVHHASKYADLGAAVGQSDGLAVLGFFFEIGTTNNDNWETLINVLTQVTHNADEATVPSALSLLALLPSDRSVFYRYQGSLTTPNCNEVVTWTVFKETIKISATQMNKFRSLKSNTQGSTDVILSGNYRPIQALQGRTVYMNAAYTVRVLYGLLYTSILASVVLSV